MKVPNITEQQSKGALIILSMVAKATPEIVKEKFQLLVSIGLGPRYKEDEEIAKYTCIALQKLCSTRIEDGEKKTKSKRYPTNYPLFQKLSSVLKEESNSTSKWFPAAEQAINAIYVLAENPDTICSPVIKFLASKLTSKQQIVSNDNSEKTSTTSSPSSIHLSRFLFVIGHVALRQMQYLEEIQTELTRRKNLVENSNQNNNGLF